MPIEVEYKRNGTFIHAVGRGTVTDEEFRSFMRELYSSEERARLYRGALIDWSRVEAVMVTDEALEEAADIHRQAQGIVLPGTAIAIAAPQALAFSLARLWEGYVEGTGRETRVFVDVGEAEEWLEKQLESVPATSPRRSLRLQPPSLETQFREESLKRDTRVVTGLMFFSLLFHLLSFPIDWEFLEGSDALGTVWILRGAGAGLAVAGILLLRRKPGVAAFDNLITVWAAALLLGVAVANALLPATYMAHVAWDLFLVLAVYAVLPLPLGRQVMLASIITVGDILLFWQHKVLTWSITPGDVTAALACANLLGVFASWELQHSRRQEFQALHREAETGERLRKAWMEVQALRGIIPICMHCKKVRSDEGFWERVEDYVGSRSQVVFSHGICPDCVDEHFPEGGK